MMASSSIDRLVVVLEVLEVLLVEVFGQVGLVVEDVVI